MTAAPFGVDPAYVRPPSTRRKVVRRTLIVVAVILVLNLLNVVLAPWLDPQTDGPFGSSFVTTEQGTGMWHDVLSEVGRSTHRTRVPFSAATVDPTSTVVVVDPEIEEFDRGYANSLQRHAESGGRVVLVGVRNVARLFDVDVQLSEAPAATIAAGGASPLLDGVALVAVDEGPRYVTSDDAIEVVLADATGGVVVRVVRGDGDLLLVADPWMFTNDWFTREDNAVLAVRLAGGAPVTFDEYVHGFGLDQGIQGLGRTLIVVAVVGLLAAFVAMWAVGKRLGPPEQSIRRLPPQRVEYLDAMAHNLARTKDLAAYEGLRLRALRHVHRVGARYVGLTAAEQEAKAAAHLGLTTEDVGALAHPLERREDITPMATAAAKIEVGREGSTGWRD